MFTGIVEERGEIVSVSPIEGGVRCTVRASFATEVAIGDSVAVNGCCLTAIQAGGGELAFDLLAETRRVTNLGELTSGDGVNLERSLRFDGRVGGHFVSGHIDATAPIGAFEKRGDDFFLSVEIPERFRHYLVEKGCIAIDGISLTIASLTDQGFAVWLIPHTLQVTNLRDRKPGDHVNLEFDILAKYVERMLAARDSK